MKYLKLFENFDENHKFSQILLLLQSGDSDNFDLAEQLIIGQGLSDFVNARYNKLLRLTKLTIRELFEATEIDFSDKKLTEIPIGLFDLVKLETLWLNDNQLKELPSEFGETC